MAITVGTLVVDIQANTASFVSGLDKAGQISLTSARNMSRAFTVMAGVVSGAFLAAEGAMVAMVQSAITNAARLHDVAQAAGTSTAALSALEYAAKQSGLSAEQFDKGLEKMSKSMLAAASAGRDGQNAYKALGVAVADATGRLRPTQDVLTDLAAKFKAMPDGPMKTASALQIFGRAGADLVPLLNEGKEGITALMAEAQRLGLVVGDDFANAADQFEDSMERMKGAAQGAANSIARDSLPYLNYILQSISDNLTNTQSRVHDLAAASGISIQAIIVLFSQFQTAIDNAGLRFKHFAAEFIINADATGEAVKAILSGDFKDLAGISDRAKAHIKENDELFVADENRLWRDNAAAITEYLLAPERASGSRKAPRTSSPSAPSGDAAANENAAAAIERKIKALEAAAAAASKEASAQEGNTAATWQHIAAAVAQQKIDELNAQASEKHIPLLDKDQEARIRGAETLKAFASKVGDVNKSLADSILTTNQQAAATRAMAAAYAEGGAAMAKAEADAKLEPFREQVRQTQLAVDMANQSGDRISKEGLADLAKAALVAKDNLGAMTVAVRLSTAATQQGGTDKLIEDTNRWTKSQEALVKALFLGSAAMREQFIEQKRQEFLADKGQDPARVGEYIAALRRQLDAQRVLAAEQRLDSTQRRKDLEDELNGLRELRAQLIENGATTLDIDSKIHALEVQKLRDYADQLLQLDSLSAGAKAFFLTFNKGATDAQKAYDILQRGFDDLTSNIAKALTGQKASWHDFLTSLAEMFTKFMLNAAFQKLFSFLGLGGSGGGIFSSIFSSAFGGGRQGGGDVNPGQFYLVGENGPEVLAPQVPGTVIPHGAISAGGGQQMTQQNYVTIHVETPDVDSFNRSREQIAGDFGAALSRAARRR